MSETTPKLGQEFVTKVTQSDGPELSVLGAGAMDQGVWLKRYSQRFVDVGALDDEQAHAYSQTESFAVLSDGFEDDPEGAADMEMSYWDE